MSVQETRIFPLSHSMASEYAIVSMPSTAWYWLDDLVTHHYPGGYKSLVHGLPAKTPDGIANALSCKAQEHCDHQMGALYALANDNKNTSPKPLRVNPGHPCTPNISARMPSVYQLFRFMPHATYLTTVWERRNYHLRDEL